MEKVKYFLYLIKTRDSFLFEQNKTKPNQEKKKGRIFVKEHLETAT